MSESNRSTAVLVSILITYLSVIAAIGVFAIKGCSGYHNTHSGVTSETTFVSDTAINVGVDSTPIVINNTNLFDTPTVELVFIEVPAVIDTLEILRRYFSCKSITYHYRKDSVYDLIISDSSCMSELVNRNIQFKNLKPDSNIIITNTTTIKETTVLDKARWYVGISSSPFLPFAPGLFYAHKRFAVNANYEPFKNQFQAGLYINIK